MVESLEKTALKENPHILREWIPAAGIGFAVRDRRRGLETALDQEAEIPELHTFISTPYGGPMFFSGSSYVSFQVAATLAVGYGIVQLVSAFV